MYLGIGGREFHCDTSAGDLERGSSFTYTFGEGANVLDGNYNNPRTPQLLLEHVGRFPTYVRLEQGSHSEWKVK